jgi:hypothetical protein
VEAAPAGKATSRAKATAPAQTRRKRGGSLAQDANRPAPSRGQGTLAINAPAGCEVRIDGRVEGMTPLPGPLTVLAGRHRVQVIQGTAQWQQAFSIGDGDQLTADVRFETRPPP